MSRPSVIPSEVEESLEIALGAAVFPRYDILGIIGALSSLVLRELGLHTQGVTAS